MGTEGYGKGDFMRKTMKFMLLQAVIMLIAACVLIIVAPQYYEEHTVTGKVLDKERVIKNQESYYLIYTDNETFTIKDSLIKYRFRSSDLYGQIEERQTYEFTVYGWRNGFFSSYRNILKAEII